MNNKRFQIATALAVTLGLFAIPAFAADPPQIEAGPIVHQVRNVTTGGGFQNDLVSASCNDVLEFKTTVHNVNNSGDPSDTSELQNVVVKATLPSGQVANFTSTTTITASNADSVSDTATVNLSSAASIQFLSGPPGITQGGTSLGTVRKLQEVTFQVKVVCPVAVIPPPPVGGVPAPQPVAPQPQPLAPTGPEAEIALGALAAALTGAAYFTSRRRLRDSVVNPKTKR